MDVFHMTYMENTTFHKLKKHPVYKDKSDARRKVVIVREHLSETLCSEQFFSKFRYMLHYCWLTMNLYKKLY